MFIFGLLYSASIVAQYPRIPKEVQAEANQMMEEARRQSDIAWKRPCLLSKKRLGPEGLTSLGQRDRPISRKPIFPPSPELKGRRL